MKRVGSAHMPSQVPVCRSLRKNVRRLFVLLISANLYTMAKSGQTLHVLP